MTSIRHMGKSAGFGAELRVIRQALGLSLEGVEEKSGGRFKFAVVGSWERGDRHPRVEAVRALLDFYGGYRLEILAPGDVVYGGELDDTTVQWVVVGPGRTVLNAESRGHALAVSATWDGSVVGHQLTGPIVFEEGA